MLLLLLLVVAYLSWGYECAKNSRYGCIPGVITGVKGSRECDNTRQGSRAWDCTDRVFTRRAKPNREGINQLQKRATWQEVGEEGRLREGLSHTVAESFHEGKIWVSR